MCLAGEEKKMKNFNRALSIFTINSYCVTHTHLHTHTKMEYEAKAKKLKKSCDSD